MPAERCAPLGRDYLRCAERGELPGPAAAVLSAIRAGDAPAAARRAGRLGEWGASSGAALLWGMAAGAAVTRPDYRSSAGGGLALDGLGLGGAADRDLDALRLRLHGLGDAHLEYAVVERRGDGAGVDALGQRERAGERADRALRR